MIITYRILLCLFRFCVILVNFCMFDSWELTNGVFPHQYICAILEWTHFATWYTITIIMTMMTAERLRVVFFPFTTKTSKSRTREAYVRLLGGIPHHTKDCQTKATGRVISVELGQYHCCWCPGSLRRQDISSHDIDYVKYVGPGLTRGRILSTCVISMWSNNIKCKYICLCSLWKIQHVKS